MSRTTLPLFPTDDGWPYPDGELEELAPVDDDLDALELRVDPHAYDDLEPAEREVLFRRFGLDGDPPASMKELGAALGCTRAEARDVLGAAIDKVRIRLTATA